MGAPPERASIWNENDWEGDHSGLERRSNTHMTTPAQSQPKAWVEEEFTCLTLGVNKGGVSVDPKARDQGLRD